VTRRPRPTPVDLADLYAEPIDPDLEEEIKLEELQDRLNKLPAYAGWESDSGEADLS
jgi:hypothetical protein